MTVSSVLIIIIVAFFIVKMFTANPLEGTWVSDDSDLCLNIKKGNVAEISLRDTSENTGATVEMRYDLDREMKVLTLHLEEESEAEDGDAGQDVISAAETLEGSYEYNLEQEQLTLTEREYGNQMIFNVK